MKRLIHLLGINNVQSRVALRVAFIDSCLKDAPSRGIKQIVILGAGLDTRPFRFPFTGARVFELDYPNVLDWKEHALQKDGHKAMSERILVRVDLAHEKWPEELEKAGFDKNAKTFWVLEGLSMYLTDAENKTLLRHIQKLSKVDDEIILHTLGQAWTEKKGEGYDKQKKFFADLDVEFKSFYEKPSELLAEFGWDPKAKTWSYSEIAEELKCPERASLSTNIANFVHARFVGTTASGK